MSRIGQLLLSLFLAAVGGIAFNSFLVDAINANTLLFTLLAGIGGITILGWEHGSTEPPDPLKRFRRERDLLLYEEEDSETSKDEFIVFRSIVAFFFLLVLFNLLSGTVEVSGPTMYLLWGLTLLGEAASLVEIVIAEMH